MNKMKNNNSIKEIQNLYDKRISTSKDSVKAAGQWGSKDFVPLICNEITKKISISNNDNVIELGCGSGVLGNWINERCKSYIGIDLSKKITVEVKPVSKILADLGISKIDIIKIDTEGSEFDILTSIDPDILGRVQWIMGELHGVRDFQLLAYLSRWFDLEVHKKLNSHLFLFHARNKTVQY